MSKPFGEPLTLCGCGRSTDPHYTEHAGVMLWRASDAAAAKWFTDAELAAEYLSAAGDVYRAKAFREDTGLAVQRFVTFRRFATTPGYGEVPDGLG